MSLDALTQNINQQPAAWLQALTTFSEDYPQLLLTLKPIVFDQGRSSSQPENRDCFMLRWSLFKALMNVDAIQPQVIDVLLARLSELTDDDCEQLQLPASLFLDHLRWLEYTVDAKRVCEKLMDVVGAISGKLQREVISALPDIVADSEQKVTQMHDV